MEGNIMRFNCEFELQLTIEDIYDQKTFSIPPMIQFSMIDVFGNTTKKEVKLDNHLSSDQAVVINAGSSPQEVVIPREAYDIETIITMMKLSYAFPDRIGV